MNLPLLLVLIAMSEKRLALLLAGMRGIVPLDAACRQGVWRDALPMRPKPSGKRLGILGLGTIGRQIAQRALGFDMAVGYHNRARRADVPHAYFDSAESLA